MQEFRGVEAQEIRKPEALEYTVIKPESRMTPREARAYWDALPTEKGESVSELAGKKESEAKEGHSEKLEANENVDKKNGLTEAEKEIIKEEVGWSDGIINYIRNMKEYGIYKEANLHEVEIGGRKCLIKDDIDWNLVDEKGVSNKERIERGLAPVYKIGSGIDKIQLHHIGQKADSPLAELTNEEHRGNGNDTILHDQSIKTEIHGDGNDWDRERREYWKSRSEYNLKG